MPALAFPPDTAFDLRRRALTFEYQRGVIYQYGQVLQLEAGELTATGQHQWFLEAGQLWGDYTDGAAVDLCAHGPPVTAR